MKKSVLTLATVLALACGAAIESHADQYSGLTGFERRVLFTTTGYKLNELQTRCHNASQYKTELVVDRMIRLPGGSDYYYEVTCYHYVPVR